MEIRGFHEFEGLVLGGGSVSGLDVAYAEFPAGSETGATRRHWFVVAGDDGVVDAQPMAYGPLVEGRPFAARADILDFIVARPRSSRPDFGVATTQGFVPNGVDDVELDDLIELMCPGRDPYARRMERMRKLVDIRSRAFVAVRERLGLRLVLATARPPEFRGPAIRMTGEQVRGLEAFVSDRPWLAALAPLSEILDGSGDPARRQDELLASFGVARAASRRIGRAAGKVFLETLALIRSIPVDWVPAADDAREWAAFTAVAETLGALTGSQEWFARSLVAPSKGRWADYALALCGDVEVDGERFLASRIERNAAEVADRPVDGDRIATTFLDVAVDANDMLAALSQSLLVRDGFDDEGFADFHRFVGKLVWKAMVGERGLREVVATSRRWHDDREATERLKERTPLFSWVPGLPAWTDPVGGMSVTPIVDSHALVDEGADGEDGSGEVGLDHCVGGYGFARESARGNIRILSLRKDGRRVSTAEVAFRTEDAIRQHRARSNSPPDEEAERTLAAYMALPEVRRALSIGMPGFEPPVPWFPRTPEEVVERWLPHMTGPYRKLRPSEFIAIVDEAATRRGG